MAERNTQFIGQAGTFLDALELASRAAALDRADGLLLGFGRDIDPARYGAGPHPSSTAVSPHRDDV